MDVYRLFRDVTYTSTVGNPTFVYGSGYYTVPVKLGQSLSTIIPIVYYNFSTVSGTLTYGNPFFTVLGYEHSV